MKTWIGGMMALVLAVTVRAEGDFTRTLTPAEVEAAGLGRLTPGELGRLKELVERYRLGEVAVVAKVAEEKVAAAEAKVREVEAKAGAAPAAGKQPGWLAALITLKKTGEKPDEAEEVDSRLAGELTNFSGRRSFVLENGQVWQMIETGSYAGPALVAPRVTVRPGLAASYWLKIPAGAVRVKVKPVKLE